MRDYMRVRGYCGALLVVFMVLVALLLPAYGAPLRVGTPPPEISLSALSGGSIRLPSSLQGKVTVIHFWSSGCSTTCRTEMMVLDGLFNTYRSRGLAVVAVNVGQKGNEVKEFLKGINPTYAVVLDQDRKGALAYDSVDLPRTFIIDRKGLLRYKIIGGTDEGTLKKYVLSLL